MSSKNDPFKVPGVGLNVDTPSTWRMMQLLGSGIVHEGHAFSKSQEKHLKDFYGFSQKKDEDDAAAQLAKTQETYEARSADYWAAKALGAKSPEGKAAWEAYAQKWDRSARYGSAEPPKPPVGGSTLGLLEAGTNRNLVRYVDRDGRRVMAFLAAFLEPGEDPVKLVAQLCSQAGYDVTEDTEWMYEDEL